MKLLRTLWTFTFSERAEREFLSLDTSIQRKIDKKIAEILEKGTHPQTFMKKLTGPLKHLYTLRVENHRLLCLVRQDELTIIAVSIGHRRHVYHS